MCATMLAFWVLLAASSLANADPDRYAEERKNFQNQKLSDFTKETATYYVARRDYKRETIDRCLFAKKVGELSSGKYKYKLGAKVGGTWIHGEVPVTPVKTGSHNVPNAAKYTEDPGCFVLVKDEKAGDPIDGECDRVYQEQCGGLSMTLYDKEECAQGPKV
ncbi:hypothetical protein HPB50_012702 [Hyalomma asiaticum]|uniref:Uncharacterized protein n=1 Tax=Hyalomma asiaticum TaxID=266040 RepID=A0ACB7TGY8_HYAAI|nr:hypothetical protein HPB50_012702 [Hyalomma asiaticum]